MGRRRRRELVDGIHHVYARGVDKQTIFRDDVDRRTFLVRLERVAKEMDWIVLGYCLMDNHFHLLLQTPKMNLSLGMQSLQSAYALAFNFRHGRVGHLFQGRFGHVLVESDVQLLALTRYIARNPVEAGFCADPADWRWSSHRAMLGSQAPSWLAVDRLLSHFGTGDDLQARYARLVNNEVPGTSGTGVGAAPLGGNPQRGTEVPDT